MIIYSKIVNNIDNQNHLPDHEATYFLNMIITSSSIAFSSNLLAFASA